MNGIPRPRKDTGLYVHVPFCAGKCGYCSFHSVPVASVGPEIPFHVAETALQRARELAERFSVRGFSTAYVGGGTPTILPPDTLRGLLEGMARLAGGGGFREWTVEANPENLDPDRLALLADLGVDRISLGVQSREATALKAVGRHMDLSRTDPALELLASFWKGRLSADLMAGLPGQTPRGLEEDIRRIASAGADHISVYELTLEEGTPLAASVREGRVRLPGETETSEIWAAVREGCGRAGLARYEVSNWARSGEECLHNLGYWRSGAWVGVGPSAVSSFPLPGGGTIRIEEGRELGAYLRDPGAAASEEKVDAATAAFEFVMMAFRTREGVDAAAFKERFGCSLEDLLGETLNRWRDYLVEGERGPAPTERLLDILNRFLLDCMEEMERTAPGRLSGKGGSS